MGYLLKPSQELLWGLEIAAVTYLANVLVDFNPDKIGDWHVWGVAVLAGLARALGAALLVAIGRGRMA